MSCGGLINGLLKVAQERIVQPTDRGRFNSRATHRRTRLAQILHLFGEESWRSVYAGELEVRPPGAPTIAPVLVESELAPVGKHFATSQE